MPRVHISSRFQVRVDLLPEPRSTASAVTAELKATQASSAQSSERALRATAKAVEKEGIRLENAHSRARARARERECIRWRICQRPKVSASEVDQDAVIIYTQREANPNQRNLRVGLQRQQRTKVYSHLGPRTRKANTQATIPPTQPSLHLETSGPSPLTEDLRACITVTINGEN